MEILKFKLQDDKHDLRIELEKVDFRLRFILFSWVSEMNYRYNYTPIITEIFRTQEEQDYIYTVIAPDDMKEKYKKEHFQSVHQYGRGIDIRSTDMTQDMIDFTINFFKHVTYDINRAINTLVYHEVGSGGIHFHIQINSNGMTCIRGLL